MTENSIVGSGPVSLEVDKVDAVEMPAPALSAPSKDDDCVTAFLVELGALILKNHKQEWMDLDELHEVVQEHKVRLGGRSVGRDELETVLKDYFKDKEELYSSGINVVAHERRRKWDLLLLFRFYKYNPDCIVASTISPSISSSVINN